VHNVHVRGLWLLNWSSNPAEGVGQLVLAPNPDRCALCLRPYCVRAAPWSSLDEHGHHASLKCGQDVIVEAVSNIRDLGRSQAGRADESVEERRRRLFHTEAAGRSDRIDGHASRDERGLCLRGLITSDTQPVSQLTELPQAAQRVRVQV